MFSTTKKVPHTIRKRILAALYSKTTLYASPEIRDISNHVVAQRLLPIIEKAARNQEPLDVLELSLSFAMDFITSYLFGVVNCSDFLQDASARRQWLDAHGRTKGYGFWRLELPGLNSFLERSGVCLVPPAVAASAEEVRQLCLHLMQKADVLSSATLSVPDAGDRPVVYQQLSRALGPSCMGKGEGGDGGSSPLSESADELRLTIASELMDHIKAGTETSGWTLVYLLHEMSQRPELQKSLRKEVVLVRRGEQSVENVPSARALDTLPLLNAIILETLRLHPAVPGSQPRITPPREKSTFSLAGYTNIPPGVRIGAQAYSLHRNHDVFPRPDSWNPERWLVTDPRQKAEMMRWFWPFGSGSRMCIGNHFALMGESFFFHFWLSWQISIDVAGVGQI
jgi:unspecific monooxygenase